ncbi:hypothetical protein [Streptomyces sp. NPDC059894]|uniref:hypothetical protein n=1 Tax=unclassified Streptomyces TaxID=2593676 RepID=UPI00365E0259
MTGAAVFFFLVAAVCTALALVDQRKLNRRLAAWRYRNPGANAPSDRALAWQRVVLFSAAGVMAFQGCDVVNASDKNSWNQEELRQAVKQAASRLEEEPHLDDRYSDFSYLIESEVGDAGKGEGPAYALEVETAGAGSNKYTITADGVDESFCMRISQAESSEGGLTVPGVGDQPGTFVPEYDLEATVDEGSC